MSEIREQERIPDAPQIFHYELQEKTKRTQQWCERFFAWKQQLIDEARTKLANDPKLVVALVNLVEQIKEVTFMKQGGSWCSGLLRGYHIPTPRVRSSLRSKLFTK